jgi:superfamily II DNA or RNA helicase|tara:strand:+ start:1526 stop:3010 length:1485 start_codon:yes stop_codon:yes gene_type:complete
VADIVCRLKDYSMLYVDVDAGIAAEISDYFSFYVPGYKFMPAYKNKIWDGKIKLFNRMTGELNAGLFVYLIKFCGERGYEIDTEETDFGLPIPSKKIDTLLFNEFLGGMKLPFMPREYQYDAAITALERHNAILLSPTGSGKSFIMYLIMQYWRALLNSDSQKVLIIVPTTSLVEQLTSDFADYGMDTEKGIHKIYSGKDKSTSKKIIISTWQSIYKLPRVWFEQFGMILGDECHGFKSKSLSSIMNKSTKAKYRYGLTGTLDGTLTHKLVLEGLFGPVYKVTTTKALQDDNTLAQLDIKVLLLDYSEQTRKDFGKKTYQEEIDFIVKNEARNKLITNLTIDATGNTLVLFQRVDAHGKPLFTMINNKVEADRKVFFVSGEVDTSDREAIRKIVEKQNNAIIVASLGTFSTGINIRNLHNIVFASPSKSQIRVLQSIGRGLRQSDDGRTTVLYDIADDLHWGKQKNFTLLHSAERVKMYSKEQFNYKLIKVDLP